MACARKWKNRTATIRYYILINVGMSTDMWTNDHPKISFVAIPSHYITPNPRNTKDKDCCSYSEQSCMVTDQGSKWLLLLHPVAWTAGTRSLLRLALDMAELKKTVPKVAESLLAANPLVNYAK